MSARTSRVVLCLVTVAAVATSLPACKNKKELARQRAELTAALDAFKTQVAQQQQEAAPLRARLNALPEDLPGLESVRADLFAVEEGLGVEDGRGKWLSGEIEKAFASGKKEDIDAVRNAIPATGDDGFRKLMVKVMHELLPYERMVAQSRAFEALEAAKAAGGRGGQKQR